VAGKRKVEPVLHGLLAVADAISDLIDKDSDAKSGYDIAEAIEKGCQVIADALIEAAEIQAKLPESERRFKR
jgi:hypothetical protein